jgi:hypothetical protein
MAFATAEQLTDYVAAGTEIPDDADRLLTRASELIDEVTFRRATDAWTSPLPDPPTEEQAALRDATCAQVEFWLAWGEDHDIEGIRGPVSLGSLRLDELPMELGPRARRHLSLAGLLYAGVRA